MHLWEIQVVRDIVLIGLVLLLIRLGFQLSLVTVPLFLGLFLAYLLEPAIGPLARRTNRSVAAALVVGGFVVFVVLPLLVGVTFASLQGVEQARRLERNWPRVVERVEGWLERAGIETEQPPEEAEPRTEAEAETLADGDSRPQPSDPSTERGERDAAQTRDPDRIETEPSAEPPAAAEKSEAPAKPSLVPARIAGLPIPLFLREYLSEVGAGGLAASAQDALAMLWKALVASGMFFFKYVFLTATFFFFCSVGLERLSRRGPSLVPRTHRERVMDVVAKMNRAIAGFVRGRLLIALILALLHTLGYWLVGVPAPVLFGAVVGLLTIVPYLSILGWIGSTVAFAISQVGASEPAAWWWVLLGPALVYVVLQPVDDYILTPRIQGEQTGLSTPVVLFAAIGGGALAGVYGVLIAIPFAACAKIFIVEVLLPPYRAWVEGRAEDPLPREDASKP